MYNSGQFVNLPDCSSCSPNSCNLNGTAEAIFCFGRLDPEGPLSSFPTVLTAFFGYFFGNIIAYYPNQRKRLGHWIGLSAVWFVLGIIIHFSGWPMNKQMWSPSYLFMMAGACGFTVTLCYCLLDYRDWQPNILRNGLQFFRWQVRATDILVPFVWVGMNGIFIYLMSPDSGNIFDHILQYFYWKKTSNNLNDLTYSWAFCGTCISPGCNICDGGIFNGFLVKYGMMWWTLFRILCWIGVAGFMHYKKIYIAL